MIPVIHNSHYYWVGGPPGVYRRMGGAGQARRDRVSNQLTLQTTEYLFLSKE